MLFRSKEDMQHQLVKVDENGEINDESYRVNVRGAEIEQQKAIVAIVVSLFMYIAFKMCIRDRL